MSHTISQTLLLEFDHEMGNTRKTIERVPEGIGTFAPHAKSMKLERLAGHVVELVGWAGSVLSTDSFDLSPAEGPKPEWYLFTSRAEALSKFDASMKQARTLLAGVTDEQMMEPWVLKAGQHTIFTLPRILAFRGFVLNHLIHHRAQLGVYLRLNGVPVPGLYGPSADEM